MLAEALAPDAHVPAPARTPGAGSWQDFDWRRKAVAGSEADAGPSQTDGNAPLRPSETVPALPIAAVLFRALNEAGLRYGIAKNLASLEGAFAGRDDLDVLLDKQDYPAFCSIVSRLHGRRSVSLSCYDNVCAGREDWFLPDFSRGRYLHLDMHIGIRVGWAFRKRYLAVEYAAITRWESIYVEGVSVPVVSPEDEARITIIRFAFRAWVLPWRQWVPVRDRWEDQFARLPFRCSQQGLHVVEYTFGGGRTASCRFRQSDDGLVAHRRDLTRLRRSIREMCGFTGRYGIADAAVHLARKTSYLAVSFLQRLMPGALPPKRRPAAGGLVVALIGPDGLGKSTQVDRLTQIFRWKFDCAQAYCGTGEGSGWRLRKALQTLVFPHRRRLKAPIQDDHGDSCQRNWTIGGLVAATGLAFWAVLIAFERYAVVKRAHRSATRGLIVICDRWPQTLRRGYLDGPTIPEHLFSIPGLSALARLEQKLYQKMEECRPHLILHLVSDFAVSEQRKPGEIRKEAFDARLSLMAELRTRDKDIRTVDASASLETVNRELFRHIWLSL